MTPLLLMLLTLLAGMFVVIGGILILKLDPFLALILAALVVGLLTPSGSVERAAQEKARIPIASVDSDGSTLRLNPKSTAGLKVGSVLLLARAERELAPFREIAELAVERIEGSLVTARLKDGTPLRIGSQSAVLTPADMAAARQQGQMITPDRIARGFGNTCASIGILIAMASIIGKCLLDSGAADRIVRSAMKVCGERGAPVAFVITGFTLAIPVFFDTVFYLMIPLAKATRLRTGRNYLLYVMAIFTGGTMAHSLVPPTPGPLFVAEALNVELGMMMLVGGVVGLFASSCGFLASALLSRRMDVPLRDTSDVSLEELAQAMRRQDHELPPLWLSLTPILLPVVLIGGLAILPYFADRLPASVVQGWEFLGDKNLALMVSAAIAILMLVWQRRTSFSTLRPAIQSALASAGSIILITAAGGAFGSMLQETGIATAVRNLPSASTPTVIALAFLITAAIRTAQGSATVAMITAVGVLESFVTSGSLTCHPVYLAVAIGCGSKPFSWMNDSGFWVISRMSGLTEAETLKSVTPLSGVMGVAGLLATVAGALLLPLK